MRDSMLGLLVTNLWWRVGGWVQRRWRARHVRLKPVSDGWLADWYRVSRW